MKKRFLAVLLATVLSVSMASQTIYATELPSENPTSQEEPPREETEDTTEETVGETTEENVTEENPTDENGLEEDESEEIVESITEDELAFREDFVLPPGGYREVEEVPIESIYDYPDDYVPRRRGVNSLESKYVTSTLPDLRNQGSYGSCWAHATMALAEISLLKQGKCTQTDLSELHLAYFSYHPVLDPLGGITDDVNGCSSSDCLNAGGNVMLSENILASWVGAADEETVPYSSAPSVLSSGLNKGLSFDDVAHLTNYYETEFSADNLLPAKELIKEYGAIGVSFSAQDAYNGGADGSVYNYVNNAYYNPTASATNHSVVIVGWDDNFSKDNFNVTPPGDGAWLVRNSWTTGSYEENQTYNGYFWMSYYEATLENRATAFVFDTAENYENNYQYDGGMQTGTVRGYDKYANVFTAHADGGAAGEILKAASFYTSSTNVSYKIEVYTGLSDVSNPASGTVSATAQGTTKFAGYYTVALPQSVSLDAGETFAIVVTLTKSGDTPHMGFESSVKNWYTVSTSFCEGQSLCYSGGSWQDFCEVYKGNLRIKAFTDNAEPENPIEPVSISFGDEIDTSGVTIGIGEAYRLSPIISPSDATNKKLTWTSSDESIVRVSNGVLTGVKAGTAEVTATAVLGGCSKTITVTVDASRITALTIGYSTNLTNNGAVSVQKGKTCQFSVTPTPSDVVVTDVEWTSSDESILTIDEKGKATGIKIGTVTVTARVGEVTQSIQAAVFPQAVQSSINVTDDNTIELSWKAVEGATAYKVQMLGQEGNSLVQKVDVDIATEDGKNGYTYTIDYYTGQNLQNNLQVRIKITTVEGLYSNTISTNVFVGPVYTITYHVGDGSNNPGNPTTYKYYKYPSGFRLLNPNAPIGYHFVGWYNDASYTGSVGAIQYYDTGNKDFYAKYEPNSYSIKYYSNDGSERNASQTCKYGTNATLKTSSAFPRSGYTLVGWNTKADGSGTSYGLGTTVKNLCEENGGVYNLYAQWEPISVTVTLNANNGTVDGKSTKTITVKYGQTYGSLPEPVRAGYEFLGWRMGYSSGVYVDDTTQVTKTNAHSLYAQWKASTYTLTMDANGGTVEGNATATKDIVFASTYGTLPDPLREGYSFDGWYTAVSGGTKINATTTVSVTNDTTVYARWKANMYTITYNANGGTVSSSSKTVTYGQTYGTLPTPTKAGYTFAGWVLSDDESTVITNNTVVSIASHHTLLAKWTTESYSLIFDVNGGDTVSEISRSVEYKTAYGALPTATKVGYDFDGWYTAAIGGVEVNENTLFESTGNVTVYAHWTAKNYTVTLNANSGTVEDSATSDVTVTYDTCYGELPDAVKEGYTFVGWFTQAEGGVAVTEATVVTTADNHTLYAHFRGTEYKVTFDGNGGNVKYADRLKSVYYDDVYGVLPIPTLTNKEFAGWYTAADGGTKVEDTTVVKTAGNHTLYAHWRERTGWVTSGRKTYYIDPETEKKVTGPQIIEGKNYYFDTKGARRTGWVNHDDKTYYYSPTTGEMQTGSITVNGNEYYMDAAGEMQTGWVSVGGKVYYYDTVVGKKQTGWITVNDATYYLGETGEKETGKVTIDEKDYILSDTGALQTGLVTYEGESYVLTEEGFAANGWVTLADGSEVYADPVTGKVKKSALVTDGEHMYYLDASGAKIIGWHTDNSGNKYYFDKDGIATIGWATIDGATYYFDKNGAAAKDFRVVDKKLYFFATAAYVAANSDISENSLITNATVTEFTAKDSGVLTSDTTHWLTLSDGQYYVTKKGVAVTGWLEKGDDRYYMDTETGAMVCGAKRIGFKIYYFDTDGKLVRGGTTPNIPVVGSDETVSYTIRDDGSLVTGWRIDGYIPAPRTSKTLAVAENTYEVVESGNATTGTTTFSTMEISSSDTSSDVMTVSGENNGNVTTVSGENNGGVTTVMISSADDVHIVENERNRIPYIVWITMVSFVTAFALKRRKR